MKKYNDIRNRGISGQMGGMGMHKHAISGRSYNKAHSIKRSLELNKAHDHESQRRDRLKRRDWKRSVKEVFKDYGYD